MKTKIIQKVHIGKYPYSVTMVMAVRGSKPMFGPLSGLTVKYGASGTKPGHVKKMSWRPSGQFYNHLEPISLCIVLYVLLFGNGDLSLCWILVMCEVMCVW